MSDAYDVEKLDELRGQVDEVIFSIDEGKM